MKDPTAALLVSLMNDDLPEDAHTTIYNVQDALDGAALRRLREATGKRKVEVSIFETSIVVVRVPYVHAAGGDTIAEAADECREALE